MYIYIYMYMCVCMCSYVYIYIYIYNHIHMCTFVCVFVCAFVYQWIDDHPRIWLRHLCAPTFNHGLLKRKKFDSPTVILGGSGLQPFSWGVTAL